MAFTYVYYYEALVMETCFPSMMGTEGCDWSKQVMNQSEEEAMCNLLNNGFSNPFLTSMAVLDCQGF
jgi:hypothetical protein